MEVGSLAEQSILLWRVYGKSVSIQDIAPDSCLIVFFLFSWSLSAECRRILVHHLLPVHRWELLGLSSGRVGSQRQSLIDVRRVNHHSMQEVPLDAKRRRKPVKTKVSAG